MKLLDVSCGTAHIIENLAVQHKSAIFIGLDVSPAMLKIAKLNTMKLPIIILIEGDGLKLPFLDDSFDVVITRLAKYSPQEAYRVLKKGGFFFEYNLGPEANKEIIEFFFERIEKESFFIPNNFREWKEEVCGKVVDAGFSVESVEDYEEKEYYKSVEEPMNLIEMAPLVKNFNREKGRGNRRKTCKKISDQKGHPNHLALLHFNSTTILVSAIRRKIKIQNNV